MKILDWPLVAPPLFLLLLIFLSWKDIRKLYIESVDLIFLALYTVFNFSWLFVKQDYSVLWSNLYGTFFVGTVFFLIYIFSRKKGVGEGELYVAPLMYSNIGLRNSLEALYFCFLIGALYCIVGLLFKLLHRQQALPFIPFLTAGLIFSLLFP
jgi:leader peptidase (prepilin peptidase) / N-methyltransferase